jgi:hypothetical protein
MLNVSVRPQPAAVAAVSALAATAGKTSSDGILVEQIAVDEDGHDARPWHHLAQLFHLLLHQLRAQVGHACGVAAWSV